MLYEKLVPRFLMNHGIEGMYSADDMFPAPNTHLSYLRSSVHAI
jgi:hypothetical protein